MELSPGLLESAYEVCLFHELSLRALKVERQKSIPITYKGIKLDGGYRLDLLVEDQVIVEVKSVAPWSFTQQRHKGEQKKAPLRLDSVVKL